MDGARRYRRSRVLHRILNPGALARLRLTKTRRYALIETTGRRSGRPRRTPVSYEQDGSTVWVVAIHGEHADWVRNIRSNPDVRIKIGPDWHNATAELVPDDDIEARAKMWSRTDRAYGRVLGTDFLAVRIDLAG